MYIYQPDCGKGLFTTTKVYLPSFILHKIGMKVLYIKKLSISTMCHPSCGVFITECRTVLCFSLTRSGPHRTFHCWVMWASLCPSPRCDGIQQAWTASSCAWATASPASCACGSRVGWCSAWLPWGARDHALSHRLQHVQTRACAATSAYSCGMYRDINKCVCMILC